MKKIIFSILCFFISTNSYALEHSSLRSYEINKEIESKKEVRLLFFFASWCGVCKSSFNEAIRLQNKYKDKNLNVYLISLDDNSFRLNEFLSRYDDLDMNVYRISKDDNLSNIFERFRINYTGSIPHVTLLNKNGSKIADGPYDIAAFDSGLDRIFNIK